MSGRDNAASPFRRWISVLAVGIALGALVLTVHRLSPRTFFSAHGLLHAAIARGFLDHGLTTIPPENPFFAGEPLPYYWVYHALGAAVARAFGMDPIHAFEMLTVAAALTLALFAGGLAKTVMGDLRVGALGAYLVVAGANVQAPLILAARWLRSGDEIFRDDGSYLWGLVHPYLSAMRIGDPFGMYGPLVNFFLNVTARPLALASLLGAAWAFARLLEAPTLARAGIVGLAAAVCSAMSPLLGLTALPLLGAAGVAVALLDRRRRAADPHPAPRAAALGLACMAIGIAAASPSFVHLFAVSSGETRLFAGGLAGLARRLVTLGTAGWLLVGLAFIGCRSAARRERGILLVLTLAGLALWGGAALLTLPEGNQDNLFHAGIVLLALPAASSARARRGSEGDVRSLAPARGALVVLAFLPTFGLVVGAYLGRPPVALEATRGQLRRTPADADLAQLYAFVAERTEPDAVVVIDPRPPVRAAVGNTAELPALTGRAIWTENERHYVVRSHRDAAVRTAIARRLVEGEAPTPAEIDALAALGRPIYVLAERVSDPAHAAQLTAAFGPAVFAAREVALYPLAGVMRQIPSRP